MSNYGLTQSLILGKHVNMQPDFSKQQGQRQCQRLRVLGNRALALCTHFCKALTLNIPFPHPCVLDAGYIANCIL